MDFDILLDITIQKDHKFLAIDLSKQQPLDADLNATKKVNFTRNLDRQGNTKSFLIIEEAKETILEFSQRTVKGLQIYFALI